MPYIRPAFAFLCYTTIPGILILHVLRLYNIDILHKFVVIIGLSISFLLFFGLLINNLYLSLGLSKPLSTQSLVITFSFILIIFLLIAYNRNKNDFQILQILNFNFNVKKDHLLSLLVFPFLFPFLSVFGTYLMNKQQNNNILLLMLFLIPAYVLAIVYLRRKTYDLTYPLALFNIALAVVLMHGLTSNYINGRDVHTEYHSFCIVAKNLYWSLSDFQHAYMACLSSSMLPTVYWSLMGVEKLYIYKFWYQLIWAIVPVICYILYKNYVSNLSAFLSSFLIISQTAYIFTLQSAIRNEFGLFFLILVMVTFFNKDINEMNKRILFIIFSFSMILSHYTTSYFFLFVMISYFTFTSVYKNTDSKLSTTIVLLIFAQVFLWYGLVTKLTFSNCVELIKNIFESLITTTSTAGTKSPSAYTIFGYTITNPAKKISVIVFDIILGITTIGLISSVMDKNLKSMKDYSLISFISYLMISSFILLPYLSLNYGTQRVYLQGILIFAPFLIIGSESIVNFTKRKHLCRKRLCLSLVTLLIISQFFCGTYLLHQLYGIPRSEDLNHEGGDYGEYYIHDQEVIAAQWLSTYNNQNRDIYTDFPGYSRIMLGYGDNLPTVRSDLFAKNESLSGGYIYLRTFNVVDGIIQLAVVNNEDYTRISDYSHIFSTRFKLYNNGGSEIWN